jgi:adenylyltransferase/sulfurtransferase
MKEITSTELKALLDKGETIQIIDVREAYEYEAANIGGELIPLSTVGSSADRIRRDITVVLHCKAGMRSAAAIYELESRHGFTNLFNLKGGILSYANEIDPSLQVI